MLAEPLPASRGSFWERLSDLGGAPALVWEDGRMTYAELADRSVELVERLGPTRRLVLLEARNDASTVVGYLACLQGGHPVILVDAANAAATAALTAAYDPDVVLGDGLLERRVGTVHDLHPELALLLSTSGSTGSPKLVRLSARNVAGNADSIADSLGIRSGDVAATTLPLHYCYGLSLLTSHLAAGAAVAVTDLSVVDPCFWDLVRRQRVTTFAGVPHTFELLDRIGFAALDVPSLRYLTQAGGRMAPETVRRYAELGRARGFDLVVMYGATEATARMAYLPPDLALNAPHTVGVPIPGGSITLDPLRGEPPLADDAGELVYRGDNVMLGYAESPNDLRRGREVVELRTGDLARRTPEGLIEIVGRIGRFAKVFGLRIDLTQVEAELREAGLVGYAADGGDHVVVGLDPSSGPKVEEAHRFLTGRLGIPKSGCRVVPLDQVPRLGSGKPDYVTLTRVADLEGGPSGYEGRLASTAGAARVFQVVLGKEQVLPQDTFVSLGGDSLSYVEASLRLESVLGRLPPDWHLLPVAELERGAGGDRGPGRAVETNVLLRALAIVAIVGSHSNLFTLLGGAHLLVGLAGFNFGRFQMTDRPQPERVRRLLTSTARIVVPSVLWLTFAAATSDKYGPTNVVLLTGVLGSREWTEAWHYWFVEALVWTLLALTAALAVPWVDRLERRWSFWLPFGLAVAALVTRYDVVRLFDGDYIHRGHVLFWLFALGWAAVKASTSRHRLLVSAVVSATVPGFFEGGQHVREAVIVAGMLLLVWVPTVRMPAPLARVSGVLAAASLYIYLCHWQIYPAYEFRLPWLATLLSLSAGIAFWLVASRVTAYVESRPARRAQAGAGRSGPDAPSGGLDEIRDNRGRLSRRR